MKAVILAAGEGTRMHPLTLAISKMMLPLAGRPLLEHTLLTLKEAGIDSAALVVGYRKQDILEHLDELGRLGVRLSYVEQRKQMGTAHALSLSRVNETFVALNGDVLFDPSSLSAMVEEHKRARAAATLGAHRVEDPSSYGILLTRGERVVKLVEKPRRSPSKLANAGVYVFEPAIFDAIGRTKPSRRGELEITSSIQRLIAGGEVVRARELKWWMDLGRPWELLDANEHLLKRQVASMKGIVEPNAKVVGNVSIGEGTRVRSGAYVEGPTCIGRNCDVGPNCYVRPYTSIGDGVRIGNGVEIKNSIIMDNTQIGHLSYVGDSIVGRGCNFGAGTKVGNLRLDDKNVVMTIKGKRVDTGRRKLGAVIADGVKTGLNCVINPGLKLGPNSVVGPGVVLYKDLPPNRCVLVKQRVEETRWP